MVIPYTTAQRIEEKRTVEEIWAKTASSKDAELATVQLGRIFQREIGSAPNVPLPSDGNETVEVEGPDMVMVENQYRNRTKLIYLLSAVTPLPLPILINW